MFCKHLDRGKVFKSWRDSLVFEDNNEKELFVLNKESVVLQCHSLFS